MWIVEMDLELGDLLQEFNDVVKELSSEHVLRDVKRHTGVNDGDDSDYCKYTTCQTTQLT